MIKDDMIKVFTILNNYSYRSFLSKWTDTCSNNAGRHIRTYTDRLFHERMDVIKYVSNLLQIKY